MTVSSDLRHADIEMRRFIKEQYKNNLGYPTICVLARNVSRGTVTLPPPTEEDPLLDCVGAFHIGLRPIEKRMILERYVGSGGIRARARRLGKSVGAFYRATNKILWRCHYWMLERGF